ncbi:MAG: hypothetical protein COA86_17295 [Kangiella sp.]|nr:MAG: hypothetical protein COA86_17295 [Kangiella sp.]
MKKQLSITSTFKKALLIALALVGAIFFNNISAVEIDNPAKKIQLELKSPTKALKISIMDKNQPFTFTLPNGKPSGLYVDIWREWSKVTGREIEFVTSDFSINIQQLKNGQADFHSGLFINTGREEWAVFSDPIDRIETKLFFDADNRRFSKIEQLNGKKLGVGNASFQEAYIRENYQDIQVFSYKDTEKMINDLLDGYIDAIVAEVPSLNANMAKMGIIGALRIGDKVLLSNTAHALVPKRNKHLIPIINEGIFKLEIDKIIQLEKKWLPGHAAFFELYKKQNSIALTQQEQQFLIDHRSLLLGVDKGWKPIEYVDDDGKFSGVTSDFVKIISDKLSIQLKPEIGNKWAVVLEKVKKGELDILSGVVRSKEREQYLSFTKPYISFPMIIATQKNARPLVNMSFLDGKKVAAVASSTKANLLIKHHPNIILVPTDTLKDGLAMLESGQVFGLMDSIAIIADYTNNNPSTNIHIALHTPYSSDLSFAVRRGLEPLIPILNKAFAQITEQEKDEILNRWLSVQVNIGTDFNTILTWGLPGFFILLFIIIYVVRSNAKLQTEIILRQTTEKSLNEAKSSLEKALRKAESANQSKNQFLANMSHEIRTPMNAIIGTAYLLEEMIDDKEQLKLLDILNLSSKSLLGLINDILDLSKVEAGKIELEERRFNLEELLTNVIKQVEANIALSGKNNNDKDVNIILEISNNLPTYVIGDKLRLSQILLNLMGNAIKFTEKGTVKIKVSLKSEKEKNIELEFSVEDTGIGMTKEQMEKLFETYSQADASTSRKYGGTGLGLSISKNLCQLMQGEIWVESEIGVGSQFHFTCLLKKADQRKTKEDSTNHKELYSKNYRTDKDDQLSGILLNKNILIVDDNLVNQTIAKKILENKGIITESAFSGEEALSKIENTKFDLILMDIQMPGMDGYQTTKCIREELKMTDIPIIGLSANAMEQDIDAGLKAGMNDYLSKPIKPNHLFKSLRTQLKS